MRRILVSGSIAFLITIQSALAQSFDEQAFAEKVNRALENQGVTLSTEPLRMGTYPNSFSQNWADLVLDVPEYGIAAVGPDGEVLEVFGPTAPTVVGEDGQITAIQGYEPESRVTFEIIGANQYADYVTSAGDLSSVDSGVQRAIEAIKSVTAYIAQQLCESPARPSEITMSLTADFRLVLGGSTGTTATWRLEETCGRGVD